MFIIVIYVGCVKHLHFVEDFYRIKMIQLVQEAEVMQDNLNSLKYFL